MKGMLVTVVVLSRDHGNRKDLSEASPCLTWHLWTSSKLKAFHGSHVATEQMSTGGRAGGQKVTPVSLLIWRSRLAGQAPPSLLHRSHIPFPNLHPLLKVTFPSQGELVWGQTHLVPAGTSKWMLLTCRAQHSSTSPNISKQECLQRSQARWLLRTSQEWGTGH